MSRRYHSMLCPRDCWCPDSCACTNERACDECGEGEK